MRSGLRRAVQHPGGHRQDQGIVKTAVEEDVDVIGLSCHSWEYLHYAPRLLELLKERNLKIPVMVGGSVITPGDTRDLRSMGVAAAFGPSATPEEIVGAIHRIAKKARSHKD
ncbi:MAG: cobalamin-dependent protein [Deltaproteobacteria bacterium]|nr:cobalamin-dependent protein [Deltaproteobacteria bacterium]